MKEIEVTCKLGKELTADEIQTAAVKALGVSPKIRQQLKYRIVRRSIDARNDILYRYKVEVYKPEEVMAEYVLEEYKDVSSAEPVVIIGAGPAGMFAALRLLIFSSESTLLMRWPKYWSFSFSIIPSKEIPGLIFRMDWLDLLAVQGTLKSLPQHHSSNTSILRLSAFFTVQLSHLYMTSGLPWWLRQ